jgi:hypothetical protein
MENKQKFKPGRVVLRELLLGSIFVNKDVNKWMPVVVLLVFLGLIMITNRFRGEKIVRKMAEVQEHVKEMRSESATIDMRLVNFCKYSAVVDRVSEEGLGLKQAKYPPYKIVLND